MNIYWACLDDNWVRAEKPESVAKLFFKSDKHSGDTTNLDLQYCPGFKDSIKNVFAIKSIHDYSFEINDGNVVSKLYDQSFFNNHVHIRSLEKKAFSFLANYIFFTDEKSLPMTAYEYPVFEQNNITNSCIPIQGKFDIGKWFRIIEFPFYLKNNVNEFKVEYGEIMYYIRFHTNKKINFKQFRATDLIKSYADENVASSLFLSKNFLQGQGIEKFYGLMKTKKLILKEIKNNLL